MPLGVFASAFDSTLNQFLALSQALTGFDNLDRVLAEQYFDLLSQTFGQSFECLVTNLPSIITTRDIDALYQSSQDVILQSIILLWYTGSLQGETVSADAYRQGLLWRTINTQAPGQCRGKFGDWHEPCE